MGINFRDSRAHLAAAGKIVHDLELLLKRQEVLISSTKAAASTAKESQVLLELAKLPIDRLKDATDETVRIETLRKYGFENVASVYNSSAIALERIPGITLAAAQGLKVLSDQMYQAVAQSISYGIDIDDLTKADTELIENLQGLDKLRAATKNSAHAMQPIAQSIRKSLAQTQPLNSRLKWFFTGSEKKEMALDALQEITYLVGEPTTIALVEVARAGLSALESRSDQPVEEFKKRSSDYYAILEEVTDVRPNTEANRHFNQELLDKIAAQELDTSTIKATLRQYQSFGGKFALTQGRVIIGDEMGLGKTLQAISAIAHRSLAGANRYLVVCPASVITNWMREVDARSELPIIKIHGEDHKAALQRWIELSGIGITTYDTLKSFLLSDEEIAGLKVDTVIVDEAHYIKNIWTGRTQTIARWLDRAPNVIFLTGTPLENRVDEFIALAKLLDSKMGNDLSRVALAAGPDSFRKAVAPIYLRRNTEEVLKELPELIEVVEYCTWEGVDRQIYIDAVASGNFMAMRRAAFSAQPGKQPSKLERLLELVDESFESGQKVIVFSYFRSVIDQVVVALGDRAIGPITGSVSSNQRQNIVDQFQNSPKPLALVGQIQAAGTGLNIQAASVVILCEPQIKPSLEVQAIARAHRMGQVRKVQVHRLILPESVDEQMLAMLARKQSEFDQYARDSVLANNAVDAKGASEESMAKVIVMDERRRLGIKADNDAVVIKDDE
jgi:superfamily II DNA or RNA helicase/flagellar biosynthesis/type III secretory pathway chaperone